MSAIVWGTGDFAGGVATRRGGQMPVLAVSALSGIVMLVGMAWVMGEPWPSSRNAGWAAAAGLLGAVGLTCLYRGLATGSAAVVAPTAAVVTAAVPVVFNGVTAGLPASLQLGGFALAAVGIWLVTRSPAADGKGRRGLLLALVAGCGFGAFLTLIAQVDADLVFAPLAVARTVTLALAVTLLVARGTAIPSPLAHPIALVAGLFDAGGNVFYLLARQHTRLDIAAVLSSLYPVATVVLARVISAEPVSRAQWMGAAVCLAAITLITM